MRAVKNWRVPTPPTITPVLVAELLVEGDRWPVCVHVIDHPEARAWDGHETVYLLTEGKMTAPASITITPVLVADLLAEGERMPVYVHVDRHPLALGEQVGNPDWRDGDGGGGVHRGPTAALVVDR